MKIGLSRVGTLDDARPGDESKLREARLRTARASAHWAEIPETRLVRRGPWLVDAETDLLYGLYAREVWGSGTAERRIRQPAGPAHVLRRCGHR